jgi:putative ABC transport system permease protein
VTKLALRGLFARKLRSLLTAFAVVLGVGLVAGTYVLTDTIDSSFDDIFQTANEGSDVVVKSREAIDTEQGSLPSMDAAVLDEVQRVDGVETAAGGVFDTVSYFDEDGDRIGSGGAPTFIASVAPEPFEVFNYTDGRPPQSREEVAVDALTADRYDFEIGDPLTVAGETGAKDYRVVGVAKFGEVESFGGAATVIATLAEAQRITAKEGRFDTISVAAEDGVTPGALARRVDAALPDSISVLTGTEDAAEQAADIQDDLGFLQTALLVFGGIALFVGAFTIFNTFSITVAQRMREFAMLRTLGASRRQVLATVVGEALLVGLAASVLGLFAGIGIAPALNALFKTFGADLPNTGTVVLTRTVVVSLLVGTVVTVVAALVPALRATRVPPVAALREGAVIPPGRRHRLVLPSAFLLLTTGVALISVGLFAGIDEEGTALSLLGGGAVAIFLGTALASPKLVRPLASAVGRPIERMRGVTGRIARENAVRHPGRTAVTAAALMIGLALVTFVAVFAGATQNSVDEIIDERFAGDIVIQNTDGFTFFTDAVTGTAREVEGVALASAVRTAEGQLQGQSDTITVSGVDGRTFPDLLSLEWAVGSDDTLRQLGPGQAALDKEWAADEGIVPGQRFTIATPTGREVSYTATGTFDNPDLTGQVVISADTLTADFGERRNSYVLIGVAEGADANAVRARLGDVLKDRFPNVEALDRQGYKDRVSESLNQVLGLIYVLLALAIIVSLFGIVNTLALSIHERTREIGMLRAIGMSVRQMRRIVRYEAVITALIGAVLGTVIGVFFGWIVIQPLKDDGFSFTFPAGTILAMLLLAAVAGVLAAIAPARRATKVDVLDALAYE